MSLDLAKNTFMIKPYVSTLNDYWAMYDDIPYERDADLCNAQNIRLHSGNVIKSYRCMLLTLPYEVKH